jgi:hypothetical protein
MIMLPTGMKRWDGANLLTQVKRQSGQILVSVNTKDAEAAHASGLKFAADGVVSDIPLSESVL